MVINDKMAKAINGQINAELYSAYLYLSMAAYFESVKLRGFARWMDVQTKEEYSHAMKLYEYLVAQGGRVTLTEIAAPKSEWRSPTEVFEDTYAHERKVTELINNLVVLAKAEKDSAAATMLQWFVKEQVEEEENASQIVEQLKAVNDSADALAALDRKLGERK